MSKLTHSELRIFGTLLGYSLNNGGLCHGFSCMLMQAILAQEEEVFWQRLQLIDTYKSDFSQLISEIDDVKRKAKKSHQQLSEPELARLEILAFYEGIELYLNPMHHQNIFNQQNILQHNLEEIYPLAQSAKLENSSLSIALDQDHAFNNDHLLNYLTDLEEIAKKNPGLPILVTSLNHSVLLKYNDKNPERPWMYVDTNDFQRYPQHPDFYHELNTHELATSLFHTFGMNAEHIVFNIKMVANSIQPVTADTQQAQEQLDIKYKTNPEHTVLYDQNDTGLLHIGCLNGHVKAVKRLLAHEEIEINKATNDGCTPLIIACQQDYVEVVKLLLAREDIKMNKAMDNGCTPLYIACQQGHVEVVKLLLAHEEIEINKAIYNGCTPLFIACQKGHVEVIKLLLEHKNIAVNQATQAEYTPLFIACENSHTETVKLLLAHEGIEIDKATPEGCTPLCIACQQGHTTIVNLLLQSNKINVNTCFRQYTPLLIACNSPLTKYNKELFRTLLQNKADIALKNGLGQTALDIAFLQKNNAAIEEIFGHIQTTELPLTSLMSSETTELAMQWANELAPVGSGLFNSNPLLNLKNFIQQKCNSVLQTEIASLNK